jgi:hypothetical protein
METPGCSRAQQHEHSPPITGVRLRPDVDGAARQLRLLLPLVPVEGLHRDHLSHTIIESPCLGKCMHSDSINQLVAEGLHSDHVLGAPPAQQRRNVQRVIQQGGSLYRGAVTDGPPRARRQRNAVHPKLVGAQQLGGVLAAAY